jgi:hypothetical protein
MSEEMAPPAPEAEPSQAKAVDPRLRPIILAAIGIFLLLLVAWGGNLRVNQTRISELERSVNALSEAIEPTVLVGDHAKLERLATDIAKAGGYREVTIADNAGQIIATTNATRQGKKSEALRVATSKAKAEKQDGQIKIRRAIVLAGDTRYGNLEVVIAE